MRDINGDKITLRSFLFNDRFSLTDMWAVIAIVLVVDKTNDYWWWAAAIPAILISSWGKK